MSAFEEDVDVIGECNPNPCLFDKSNEVMNVKPLLLSEGSFLWKREKILNTISSEIIDGNDIPTEFEEEIVTETCSSSNDSISPTKIHPRSLLIPRAKFKQTLTVNRSLLRPTLFPKQIQPVDIQSSSKFRQTVCLTKPTNFVLNEHTMKIFRSKIKAIQKRKAQAVAREKKKRPQKMPTQKFNKLKVQDKKKVQMKNLIYIGPQKLVPFVDPKCSGEIIRVENADSDVEVDILSNTEEDICETLGGSYNAEEISSTDTLGSLDELNDSELNDKLDRMVNELKEADINTYDLLMSEVCPDNDVILETSNITNLERFFHYEFFGNTSLTKTPERYLKIRNHIISMWKQSKPCRLSKTSARNGLKNCGDVNCIGRIHSFLEQIGAINFGTVEWVRPLRILFQLFQHNIKSKNNTAKFSRISSVKENQRIRGGDEHQDANYTIQHAGSEDSIVNRIKIRSHHRTQFELIKCQKFSSRDPPPFHVSITLSCLLCVYLHSLSSRLEIMGFIGGLTNGPKLKLTRYKPCRTSNQSAVDCEMCPMSQVEQSNKLLDEGCELLGWFHSHPSFPPMPSRTDLNTQAELQFQFAPNNKQFIGFILSCVDMEFKCIYIQNKVAFELEIEVIPDYNDLKKDIVDVLEVIDETPDGSCHETLRQKFFDTGNHLLNEYKVTENIEEIIKGIKI